MPNMQTNDDGTLPHSAWPGCYPLFYLTTCGEVLCPACANKEEPRENIIGQDANYEDASLYCDECSERIPSAYAEED